MSVVGGMPYPAQNRLLQAGVDILVATPGRLLDQMQSGRIDLSRLQMLVLDEADRMLDMGFKDDLEAIVAAHAGRPPDAALLGHARREHRPPRRRRCCKTPKRIEIDTQQARHENIAQRLHFADDLGHKNRLLNHLLRDTDMNQAIVFTATKRSADEVAQDLHSKGFAVAALHGDMNQGARTRTIQALHRGRLRVLVATDVAARGLDVQGISHVINYDLPRQAEDYVHRIGRTGRAGRNGTAISLVNAREHAQVRTIERFTAQPIPVTRDRGARAEGSRVLEALRAGAPPRGQVLRQAGRQARGPLVPPGPLRPQAKRVRLLCTELCKVT